MMGTLATVLEDFRAIIMEVQTDIKGIASVVYRVDGLWDKAPSIAELFISVPVTEVDKLLCTLQKTIADKGYVFDGAGDPKKHTAAEILDGVKAILGEREGNYDHPKRNFERIADFWNDYIKNRPDPDAPLGAVDVALMMILFKVAREEFRHVEDNLLDTIGYAVCALRCAE